MLLAQAAEAGGEAGLGSLLTQLGIGGILIYLFLKEMFAYLKSRDSRKSTERSPTADMFAIMRDIKSDVRDLHNWHDAKDEDQVFVWYVRKSLEKQIEKLAEAVMSISRASEKQTEVVEEAVGGMIDELRNLLEEVKALRAQGGQSGG